MKNSAKEPNQQSELKKESNRTILKAMLVNKAKERDKEDLRSVLEARSEALEHRNLRLSKKGSNQK